MASKLVIAASALTFTSALATAGGWDWDELDLQHRIWRSASLTWASNIHPNHPSASFLQAYVAPPPRELWCYYNEAPLPSDCSEHHTRLEAWAQDYRGWYTAWNQLYYPPECQSSCY